MTPDPDSEIEANLTRLVQSLRDGDLGARDRLVEHTFERFQRLTRQMLSGFPALRRWEQTDDVFQKAMIRLINTLEEIRPDSSAHYLRLGALQIRRELVDLTRHYLGPQGPAAHHHSGPVRSNATGAVEPPGADPNIDGPSTLAEWTEFHEAVAALPEELLAVVDLYWYQGIPQHQVAEALGVDVRTVKRRWRAARRILSGGLPPGRMARD